MKSKFFVLVLLIVKICCVWSFEIFNNPLREIEQEDIRISYKNVEWTCNLDADCTATNSSCVNEICQCPPKYVFNAAMTSCLKAVTDYGGKCEETAQCTAYMLAGGVCEKGTCICTKGYHYLHGRCRKSVGFKQKCRIDDDCYVNSDYGALSCRNQVCLCNDGYYQREYRTCRLEAMESGAECTIDLDCRYDKNALCNKYTGCFVPSTNKSETTQPRLTKYQTPRILEDQPVDSKIGYRRRCTADKECEVIGEAICDSTTGTCVCKRGYFSDPTMPRCVPEIGEKCVEGDTSTIKNSTCRFGKWSCKGATVPSKNNRICREAATLFADYCEYDEECYVFGPDASCVKSTCRCNEYSHYSYDNKFCWVNKGIGENCEVDEDCYVPGFRSKLACNTKSVCACPKDTHVNAFGTACVKDVPIIDDPCTADVDCKGLNNSMCHEGFCSCVPYYFELSGECVNGIDAPCEFDTDCKTENSTCVTHKCSCIDPYVPATADLCVLGVPYGSRCQYDAECLANTTKSHCNVTGKCSCYSNHHYRDGVCYQIKSLGQPCDPLVDECLDEFLPASMLCDEQFCRCNKGYKPSSNYKYCGLDSGGLSKHTLSSWLMLTIFAIRFMDFL